VVQSSVFGRDFHPAPSQHPALAAYDHLPLMFEPNLGQTDPQVKFMTRGNGYSLFLTDGAAVLSLAHAGRARNQQTDQVL